MSNQNKTIWITGASSGIGEALAYGYATEGANLILSSRTIETLNQVGEQCYKMGANKVDIVPIDLAKHDKIPAIIEATLQTLNSIDILINNGGISQRSSVKDTTLAVDKRIFDVNFFGAVAMTKAILPQMLQQNSGRIVVISSVAGKVSTPLRSAYAASKHALHGFYDALRYELKHTNIAVTVICPGYIKTNLSLNALTKDGSTHGKMDDNQRNGMSTSQFCKKAMQVIEKGQDEAVIGGFETLGVYLKRFFPSILKWYVGRSVVK
ncbi:MAG: SDR family oxidoreductase [Bacteroidota bacterium]